MFSIVDGWTDRVQESSTDVDATIYRFGRKFNLANRRFWIATHDEPLTHIGTRDLFSGRADELNADELGLILV